MKNIIMYVLLINIITFITMGIDKYKAIKGKWRTKETTLFILVLLGGGIGGILGMYTFRHKTQNKMFTIGFPLILITEIILIYINLM